MGSTGNAIEPGESSAREGSDSAHGIPPDTPKEKSTSERRDDLFCALSLRPKDADGPSKPSASSSGDVPVRTSRRISQRQAEARKETPSKGGGDETRKPKVQNKRKRATSISAKKAKLAKFQTEKEVEDAFKVPTMRTADILDKKREELRQIQLKRAQDKPKPTTTKTRDELMRVMQAIEAEKARQTSSRTKEALKNQQAILKKMKEANGRQDDVDVAFMLDCTSSMSEFIDASKEHIKEVVDKIKANFNCTVRVAFVGYRDHCDEKTRIQTLDFVEDVNLFKAFMEEVRAFGGGDTCEDVFGGLEASINLSWMKKNKCLIHIGDAPPHGKRFHDLGKESDHDFKLKKADRRGLRIEDLIQKMKNLGIVYYFGRINKTTDKMLKVFGEIGGTGFVHCSEMADVKNFPFFAIKSITDTIESGSMTGVLPPNTAKSGGSDKSLKLYTIVETPPDWNKIKAQQVRIVQCKVTDGKKLKMTMDYNNNVSIKISEHPFSEGGQRIAYFGIEIEKSNHFFSAFLPSKSSNSVVLKTFKHIYDNTGLDDGRGDFLYIVESQAIANHFAEEFNKIKPKEARPIHFLDVKLVEAQANDGSPVYYTLEDMFPGYEFKKFNSNWGYVNKQEFTSTLNAFSHWTYEYTNHFLMVVDLQGVLHEGRYVLTDPSIHCKDPLRFGRTNLGGFGMETFFEAHRCNQVCNLMGLKSNRHMKDGIPNPDLSSVAAPDIIDLFSI